MSLVQRGDDSWPAPLAGRVGPDAQAEPIAAATAEVWVEVELALSPIVGQRGVAALVHRSLKLTSERHAWIGQGQPALLTEVDAAALRVAFSQQTAAEAGAGALALFQAFRDLLTSLVGAALTEQLLQAAWTPPPGASPAQDKPS